MVRVYSQDISRHKHLAAWLEPFLKQVSIAVRPDCVACLYPYSLNLYLFVHLCLSDNVHETVPRVDKIEAAVKWILGLKVKSPVGRDASLFTSGRVNIFLQLKKLPYMNDILSLSSGANFSQRLRAV